MTEDQHRRDLWECSECTIGIAVDDMTFYGWGWDHDERYHFGFDSKPCGPIVAIPAHPLNSGDGPGPLSESA